MCQQVFHFEPVSSLPLVKSERILTKMTSKIWRSPPLVETRLSTNEKTDIWCLAKLLRCEQVFHWLKSDFWPIWRQIWKLLRCERVFQFLLSGFQELQQSKWWHWIKLHFIYQLVFFLYIMLTIKIHLYKVRLQGLIWLDEIFSISSKCRFLVREDLLEPLFTCLFVDVKHQDQLYSTRPLPTHPTDDGKGTEIDALKVKHWSS